MGREVPLRRRVRAHEGGRVDRRALLLQLPDHRTVHALRRRGPHRGTHHVRADRAARPAPAARHVLHAELRGAERLSSLLGRGPHPEGRLREPFPSRHADASRCHPAQRPGGPDPLVRLLPHVRAALDQRIRGRRLGHRGRLLPAGPCALAPARCDHRPAPVPLPRPPRDEVDPVALAHEHAHRRDEGRPAQRHDHRVRDDQQRRRGPPLPLRVLGPAHGGLVHLRGRHQARRHHRQHGDVRVPRGHLLLRDRVRPATRRDRRG